LHHADQRILAKRVRAELTVNSVPKAITIVSSVPIAPSGKPDKHALLSLISSPTSSPDAD
jgi:fatty-acyl-CoA synthase